MIRLTEEQMHLLRLYTGGKYKVIRDLEESLAFLQDNQAEPELQEDLQVLIATLRACTNRQVSQLRKSGMLDTEEEEAAENAFE